jgi:transaldolase/glucose-6-phosphate isomerase
MAGAPTIELALGESEERVRRQVAEWLEASVPRRLLERDPTIWFDRPVDELADRLGWLELPAVSEEVLGDWAGFAAAELEAGIETVVLLGMGGSSLAPEVFERTFGSGDRLRVLDTTHPETVRRLAATLDRESTLFVVSSKSGSTIETRTLQEYFWRWAGEEGRDAGRHFVAITDPGSSLERLAASRHMHRVFRTPPEVGGRYSALAAFGLVPAALSGVDIRELAGRAGRAADLLRSGDRSEPLLDLGAALGHLALAERDKLTLLTSPRLAAFPDWLEQLVAESTGKLGRGIVPVLDEPLRPAESYGADRFFVGLLLEEERGGDLEQALRELGAAGHPIGLIHLRDLYDLGFEIFRWEVAVALAGAVLQLNPFDQPDVQLAKQMAQAAMAGSADLASTLARLPSFESVDAAVPALVGWLHTAPPSYIAVQAFVPPSPEASRSLAALRAALSRATGCATTVGYGPRFLHSTGQLHKGGPARARFLQVTDGLTDPVSIPGEEIGFGDLIAAQADGDAAALLERGREVVRLRLSAAGGLGELAARLEEAE